MKSVLRGVGQRRSSRRDDPSPAESGARVPHFVERAGCYFRHWDSLYEAWLVKIRALVRELSEIRIEALPEREPIEVITHGVGAGSGYTLP